MLPWGALPALGDSMQRTFYYQRRLNNGLIKRAAV